MDSGNTSALISPELEKWINESAMAGLSAGMLLQRMVASGWAQSSASAAIQAVLCGAPLASVEVPPARKPMPEPSLADSPTHITAGDRKIRVLSAMRHPRVVVFGNVLDAAECKALIALAKPKLARSCIIDSQTGKHEVHAARTSEGAFFKQGENDLIKRIEARIARLVNWPVENGEDLQILRYGPGTQYEPHYDFFRLDCPSTPMMLKRGGQRIATLVMYLNTPKNGGGTVFPDVPFEVAPQRGNALFFAYDRPEPSTRTLHGGAPVSGEKWAATKWFRERKFE